MSLRALGLLALLTATALTGCTSPSQPSGAGDELDLGTLVACDLDAAGPRSPVAVIETNFGALAAELFLDMVPVTVQNFIDHVEAGSYDDTLSHRVVEGFMMQVGNLNTKGKSLDEYPFPEGGADPIPDEFHHALRHDGKGVLSMANSGPNTGTTQFFITFDETPFLDDRHAVFGQVVAGMDVLDAIDAAAGVTTQEDAQRTPPHAEVRLESVEVLCQEPTGDAAPGASLWAYDATQPVHPDGGRTQFLAVLESDADFIQDVTLTVGDVEGATVTVEEGFETVSLPARQRVAVLVDVEADAGGDLQIPLAAAYMGTELDVLTFTVERVETGAPVERGDDVEAHYIGVMEDGRIFDTSVKAVADKARDEDLGFSTFQHRGTYRSFSFTPGGGVIQGFTDLAVGTPELGSSVGRIPPRDAYGESGQSPLAGRTLLFQLDVLSVNA